MRATAFLLLLFASTLGCACGDDSGPKPHDAGPDAEVDAGDAGDSGVLPPLVCKDPEALGAGPWFTEMTDEVGVQFANVNDVVGDLRALYGGEREIPDGLTAHGIVVSGADLDDDGLLDLVTHLHLSAPVLRDPMARDDAHLMRRVMFARPGAPGAFPTFEDVTRTSGYVDSREGDWGRPSQSAVYGDVDNDGDVDVFSVQGEDLDLRAPERAEMLLNDGTGAFTLADRSGPSDDDWSLTSASFLDYDLDGNLDLFLGYHYGTNPVGRQDRLFRGHGDGTFEDVTSDVGLTTEPTIDSFARGTNHRPTYGVTVCDVDRDGDPDLLTSSYGRQLNTLWRNDGGQFVEIGRESGYAADDGLDYTDNEYYKCHCANGGGCEADPPRIACGAGPWWNDGWDDQPHRLGGNTFTTVCEDLDGDGDFDVLHGEIRHWWAGSSSDTSRPLLQEPGGDAGFQFVRPDLAEIGFEQPHVGVSWNEGNIRLGVFDFDNDGRNDVYLGSSDYPDTNGLLYRRREDGTYEETAAAAGVLVPRVNGLVLADLDGDGDRDLVTAISVFRDAGPYAFPVLRFFRNDVGQDANWTAVRLHGSGAGGANASGIGAVVEVEAGGRTQIARIDGGHGVGGVQHGLVAWFGLWDACTIDVLRVHWPDSAHSTSEFTDVRANYYLDVVQGESSVRYVVP